MELAEAQSQWFSDETLRFPKNPTIWILGWAMAPCPPGHDAPGWTIGYNKKLSNQQ